MTSDDHRGRLKVFLGYASRVGKSFRMLDEGRRRKERGQDVVVGGIQGKRAADVEALLEKLEVIPTIGDVIDVPALLARKPQVCLIDELAYDNPAGSRNPKRWNDVDELLRHGITVVTAINLQHIDELQETVERLTGRHRPEVVPAGFLRSAEEIVLVDAASEDLAVRPGEPVSEDVRRITALRELALLFAADVIEKQLKSYLDTHGLPQTWGTHERILICLAPESNAQEMLASGRRNADRFHGDLLACTIDGQQSAAEIDRVASHLDVAREYGAEIHVLHGSDFVDTVLQFAREQRITQIYVGHRASKRRTHFIRSRIERLIDEAEDFDVRLFPPLETQ